MEALSRKVEKSPFQMTTAATAATALATASGAAEAEAKAATAAAAAAAALAPPADAQMTAADSSSSDDEDSDDNESNKSSLPWLLGFVEPPTSPLSLLRHHFRSKIGGRPAWLDPCALPTPAQLCCGITGCPLDFLCQVYAPLDESESDDSDDGDEEEEDEEDKAVRRRRDNRHEDAFHRAVFVFVGPSGSALGKSNDPAIGNRSIRAFRCQLPRDNAHYSPHPPPREGCPPPKLLVDASSAVTNADRWRVAECEASIVAAAAAAAAAAGGAGQIAAAEAEAAANAAAAAFASGGGATGGGGASPPLRLFPEAELVVEEEGSDCGSDLEEAVAAAERAMKTTATARKTAVVAAAAAAADAAPPSTPAQKCGGGGREQQGEEAAEGEGEEVAAEEAEEEADAEMMDSVEAAVHPDAAAMARFAARVARAPSQVLRYCFDRRKQKSRTEKDKKDDTIWPRASPKPPSSVPPCSNCGSPRALEFQLLPQMLNFLGCDAADEEAPDWSCVGVWSCVESCSGRKGGGDASSSSGCFSSSLLPVSKTGGAGVSGGPSAYLEEFVWVQPSDAQQQGASREF